MIYTTYTHDQLLQMQPYLHRRQVYVKKADKTYKVQINEQGYYILKEVRK